MNTPNLTDRVILVPGGTGNVGEGIVRTLLTDGARVIVPSARPQRLAQLRALIGEPLAARLATVEQPYGTFDEADALARAAKADGVTDIVAAIGGWWQGKKLWEIDADIWQRYFIEPATTHMALVRGLVPVLPTTGTYTLITGFSARDPVPTAGPVSMQGAAEIMMRKALSVELQTSRRVNDILLGPIINRSRPTGRRDWLTADQVGEAVAHIIANTEIRDSSLTVETKADLERLVSGQSA
jgi:3-oxoacyl-[acyl-carrier protein] reductase